LRPTFNEIDVVERLSPTERRRFESRTGLIKAPATLILPPNAGEHLEEMLKECEIVVVFLHGLGGRRNAWGIPWDKKNEGPASQIMCSLWLRGQRALGLALARLGHDGSALSPAP